MTSVVIASTSVATFPDGGGHFWVFAQYAHGLRALGCEVHWIERLPRDGDRGRDDVAVRTFLDRVERHGLAARAALWAESEPGDASPVGDVHGMTCESLRRVVERADVFLNFDYRLDARMLGARGVTAVVDIDPALLQFWVEHGQVRLAPHDRYVTTGEHIDGDEWIHISPVVFLPEWPVRFTPEADAYTTVNAGGAGRRTASVSNDRDVRFENNKRVTFLEYVDLPRHVSRPLELAACLYVDPDAIGPGEPPRRSAEELRDWLTDYTGDAEDVALLKARGWRVRTAASVAGDPDAFRRYVQGSRGEFSCVKPSCIWFQNAWISDRTICYLASGKPAVVQHTGPSAILPDSGGLHRFATMEQAVAAFDEIERDYRGACDAARALAEDAFDSARILPRLLDELLG
jgi:hypothetical protein